MAPTPSSPGTARTAHAIFISYASRDAEAAHRLVAALERRRLTCWISARDIPPGADYQAHIVAAIEAAPVMLLVLSRNAVASKEMPKETSIASRHDRAIVPVLIDGSEVTGALSYQATSAQRLDLSSDFEGAMDRLARSLSTTLDTAEATALHLRRLATRRRLASGLIWPLALLLVLTGAATAWHFQTQLHAWHDTLAGSEAEPEASPSPAPTPAPTSKPTPAPAPPPQPPQAGPEARIRSFVQLYYATLSGPAQPVEAFLEQSLQDPVQFYSRPLPRRVVAAEQIAYLKRWPERSFVIRPDTLAVTCSAGQCTASGIIDYVLYSAPRNAGSRGAESFDLRIAPSWPPRVASITTAPLGRSQP